MLSRAPQHLAGCEACSPEAHVSPRVVKREVVSTRDGGGALSFACPNILFMSLLERLMRCMRPPLAGQVRSRLLGMCMQCMECISSLTLSRKLLMD